MPSISRGGKKTAGQLYSFKAILFAFILDFSTIQVDLEFLSQLSFNHLFFFIYKKVVLLEIVVVTT